MRLSQEPRSFDVFFELQMRAERRQPVRPSFVFSFFGPFLRLKTPRIRWFPTDTLRKWNPRPACGTAFSSVHPILSVFGLVPTRDEPAECLPWTRRTGVRRYPPLIGDVDAQSGRRWPRPRELQFVPFYEFQAGSCLYVTVAVRGGSPWASRTWSQRPKSVQGSLEPVGALVSQLLRSLFPPCFLLRLVSTPWTASR